MKQLSDLWLDGRKEKQFFLGFFNESYLKITSVATIKDSQGSMVAFANLMPAHRSYEMISVDNVTDIAKTFFQTGWFIEGLISQTLIVHFIRTSKIHLVPPGQLVNHRGGIDRKGAHHAHHHISGESHAHSQ